MEMGEGTSVFGDESELRRMLHVLIGQSGDPTSGGGTSEVNIRRQGDDVIVAVNLGPDKPATFETERAWLSRMAVRYGGRLQLEGATQTLTLPADIDLARREVENLKKELAAAQAQGEAYARELAAVFSRSDGPHSARISTSPAGGSQRPPSGEGLAVLVAGARSLGAELRGILSAIGRDIAPLRDREGEAGEIASSVGRHVTAASEVIGDLARLGACPVGELPRHSDVADLVRDVVRDDAVRAARHDVRLVVDAPDSAFEVVQVGALTVLVHALVDHAIIASPPGSQVSVQLIDDPAGIALVFDDAGPPFPPSAKSGILSREFEALAQGRPMGLALIAATALAAQLGLTLDLEDGPHGGARLRLSLPRST
jgi:signal transduction histidine kinase